MSAVFAKNAWGDIAQGDKARLAIVPADNGSVTAAGPGVVFGDGASNDSGGKSQNSNVELHNG